MGGTAIDSTQIAHKRNETEHKLFKKLGFNLVCWSPLKLNRCIADSMHFQKLNVRPPGPPQIIWDDRCERVSDNKDYLGGCGGAKCPKRFPKFKKVDHGFSHVSLVWKHWKTSIFAKDIGEFQKSVQFHLSGSVCKCTRSLRNRRDRRFAPWRLRRRPVAPTSCICKLFRGGQKVFVPINLTTVVNAWWQSGWARLVIATSCCDIRT